MLKFKFINTSALFLSTITLLSSAQASAVAPQLLANLRCHGTMNGQSIGKADGRVYVDRVSSDEKLPFLRIHLSSNNVDFLLIEHVVLAPVEFRKRTAVKNERNRVKSFEVKKHKNAVSLDESADILVRKSESLIKEEMRSITIVDTKEQRDNLTRETQLFTLRQDGFWLRESLTTVNDGERDSVLTANISCKFGKKISDKHFENIKKAAGLVEEKEEKPWWHFEFKAPGFVFPVPF